MVRLFHDLGLVPAHPIVSVYAYSFTHLTLQAIICLFSKYLDTASNTRKTPLLIFNTTNRISTRTGGVPDAAKSLENKVIQNQASSDILPQFNLRYLDHG